MQTLSKNPTPVHARLRDLPSIDKLLRLEQTAALAEIYGLPQVTDALRDVLNAVRTGLIESELTEIPEERYLLEEVERTLVEASALSLRPVINATGVIIHTNLGRAPLSHASLDAVAVISAGYSTLEYDLASGQRGSRTVHPEKLLTRLTGAESALVVNNNAAAVLLMLTALCRDREVIISRGQLVEIGGGFRIPDVLAQSGARLVEVGTTNRTHLSDYAAAITDQTAAILVTHYSNYKIIGFTSQPELDELGSLAREHGIHLLFDQGSGILLDVAPFGLEPETTVIDGLRAGCDIVAFSGDKMLGGPQAGILCGRKPLIDLIKRHPLARAVRADKMCLAALTTTLTHYIADQALRKVPVWRMIARPLAEIQAEAEGWVTRLRSEGVEASVMAGESRVGGGSLPGTSLPTCLVAIRPVGVSADELAARLRNGPVAVVGRIQDGCILLDPRTVLEEQSGDLIDCLIRSCGQRDPARGDR